MEDMNVSPIVGDVSTGMTIGSGSPLSPISDGLRQYYDPEEAGRDVFDMLFSTPGEEEDHAEYVVLTGTSVPTIEDGHTMLKYHKVAEWDWGEENLDPRIPAWEAKLLPSLANQSPEQRQFFWNCDVHTERYITFQPTGRSDPNWQGRNLLGTDSELTLRKITASDPIREDGATYVYTLGPISVEGIWMVGDIVRDQETGEYLLERRPGDPGTRGVAEVNLRLIVKDVETFVRALEAETAEQETDTQ